MLLVENKSSNPVINNFKTAFTGFNLKTMLPINCRVVAFVCDTDTMEVFKTAESEVAE